MQLPINGLAYAIQAGCFLTAQPKALLPEPQELQALLLLPQQEFADRTINAVRKELACKTQQELNGIANALKASQGNIATNQQPQRQQILGPPPQPIFLQEFAEQTTNATEKDIAPITEPPGSANVSQIPDIQANTVISKQKSQKESVDPQIHATIMENALC